MLRFCGEWTICDSSYSVYVCFLLPFIACQQISFDLQPLRSVGALAKGCKFCTYDRLREIVIANTLEDACLPYFLNRLWFVAQPGQTCSVVPTQISCWKHGAKRSSHEFSKACTSVCQRLAKADWYLCDRLRAYTALCPKKKTIL